MSDDLVKQAISELQDVVRCRCHPAFADRGLHDPDCECDSADAVKVVSDRIEALEVLLNKCATTLVGPSDEYEGCADLIYEIRAALESK